MARPLTDAELALLFATPSGPSSLSPTEQRALLTELLGRPATTADLAQITITTETTTIGPSQAPGLGTTSLGHGGGTARLPGAAPSATDDPQATESPAPPKAESAEPETKEQTLARLRRERDADNVISLRQSDSNRAQWLARVEAALATLRMPTNRAPAYGAALFNYVAEEFRHLIGHLPWATTEMGRVLRVDRADKTCRVRLASDSFRPGSVPNDRRVSYGLVAPTVGKTYPTHFPVRVTRSGQPLRAEADPEHLPWLKVPGAPKVHWLYYEQWDEAHSGGSLWRIPWERVLAGDGPNAGEIIREPNTLHMFGYHVGARAILLSTDPVGEAFPVDDWGYGGQTSTGGPGPLQTTLTEDAAATLAEIPLLSAAEPTIQVPSGIGDGTEPYASTFIVYTSLDSGGLWTNVASYAAQGSQITGPVPFQFARLTTLAATPVSGYTARADSALGPAGTRLLFYGIARTPDFTTPLSAPPVASYVLVVAFPDTPTVDEVLPLGSLYALDGTAPSLPSAPVVRQTEDGEFVCYVQLGAGSLLPAGVAFNQAPGYAMWRIRGPWGALEWTQIGTIYHIATPGFQILAGVDTLNTAPLNPMTIRAVSEDGSILIAETSGYDLDLFPDHPLIYSTDYGDSWQAFPPLWQDNLTTGTPFAREVMLVPIPDDDPRAVPVGGG